MDDFYTMSDIEMVKAISSRLKALRLEQNMSRQTLSEKSGVSVSSIARMEDGEIKSFDSLLRILRILGKLDIFRPLVKEKEISPNKYYEMIHSIKTKTRKRASKKMDDKVQEESEW